MNKLNSLVVVIFGIAMVAICNSVKADDLQVIDKAADKCFLISKQHIARCRKDADVCYRESVLNTKKILWVMNITAKKVKDKELFSRNEYKFFQHTSGFLFNPLLKVDIDGSDAVICEYITDRAC